MAQAAGITERLTIAGLRVVIADPGEKVGEAMPGRIAVVHQEDRQHRGSADAPAPPRHNSDHRIASWRTAAGVPGGR
jgi:hypothetical protein